MARGLGRGLGALIPATGPAQRDAVDRWLLGGPAQGLTGSGADPGAERASRLEPVSRETDDEPAAPGLREIPLDAIVPNPRQPRKIFDADALAELVDSIRQVGLLQPVVVRPAPATTVAGSPMYELVMGERRWRAAREAGLVTVSALVRDTEDGAMLRDALLENLHRSDLNPLEEAAAYQQLLEDAGCSQEELSRRIGRSRPQISNTLRLLRLPPAVQRRVAAGVLSAGHARALVGLSDPATQESLAGRVVAEGLSVRAIEEIAAAGSPTAAPRRATTREPRAGSAEHDEIAIQLADQLDTLVRVETTRSRGRIVIDFATTTDLRRIASVILSTQPPAAD